MSHGDRLVQVHKMKTDLEAAMVELDHIMRANELTVAVTAALPSMLVAILLGWGLLRLLMPPAPNMRTAAGPVRVAMAELEQVRLEHTLFSQCT
jgi:nuclear-control-of-ATPase protein 2